MRSGSGSHADNRRAPSARWIALARSRCWPPAAASPSARSWPPERCCRRTAPRSRCLLAPLEQLEGTPLARTRPRARARRCPNARSSRPSRADGDPHALIAALRCADPRGPLAAFHRRAATRPGRSPCLEQATARATALRGDLDEQPARRRSRCAGPTARRRRAPTCLPGDAPAGPDRLAGARARRARARALRRRSTSPRWYRADSQADRLFRLRERALSAALLDGTLGAGGLSAGRPARRCRAVALALGVRRPAARRGRDRALHRRDRRRPGRSAARPSRPTPAAAPACPICHLAARAGAVLCDRAEDALVVGWNATSLRHALAGGEPGEDAAGDARPRARRRPARACAPPTSLAARLGLAAAPLRWPWRRLRASARRGDVGRAGRAARARRRERAS